MNNKKNPLHIEPLCMEYHPFSILVVRDRISVRRYHSDSRSWYFFVRYWR